jgi:archaemetzincin
MDHDITDTCLIPLQKYWSAFFGNMEVKIMDKTIDIPSNADNLRITSRIRKDTGKIQYLASDLMDIIQARYLPKDAYWVIGILNKDLYPKPNWSFVFGCSRIRKRTGVFSFARYDPVFETTMGHDIIKNNHNIPEREKIDDKDEETQKLIMRRACKTMTHEIIHMFGIRHWIVYECLMNGTNKMQEGDLKPPVLCPVWLRKMHYAIGFDIEERFRKLK